MPISPIFKVSELFFGEASAIKGADRATPDERTELAFTNFLRAGSTRPSNEWKNVRA